MLQEKEIGARCLRPGEKGEARRHGRPFAPEDCDGKRLVHREGKGGEKLIRDQLPRGTTSYRASRKPIDSITSDKSEEGKNIKGGARCHLLALKEEGKIEKEGKAPPTVPPCGN